MEIKMEALAVVISPDNGNIFVMLGASNGELLPVRIEIYAARAIQIELKKIPFSRPLTHELIRRVIAQLKAVLRKIVITDVSRSYALLYLEQNGATIAADAAPGDAIALALRTNAPIYAESKVLEKYGLSYPEDRTLKWFELLDADDLPKF